MKIIKKILSKILSNKNIPKLLISDKEYEKILKRKIEEEEKIINANFEIINAVAMEEVNKILNKVGGSDE